MTFLELCKAVLDEADRDGSELLDVESPELTVQQQKVIGWVKAAYQRIQRQNLSWRFHYRTGLFFETEAGVEDYTVSGVRSVMCDSLKLRNVGSTGWSPLHFLEYDAWVQAFNLVVAATGRPIYFIAVPCEQENIFRLYPTPNGAYEVFATWYASNSVLETNDDEPIWHEDFHDLLKWMALEKYASEYEVPELLLPRVKSELPALMLAFYQKYLPRVRGAGALA